MEAHGYKYFHNLSQFVKILNSGKTRTINMVPKKVKNSDFMSILYGQPSREFTPPKLAIGDEVRISKSELPFRRGYKPQFTEEFFKIVALAGKKPPTYTIKDNQSLVLRSKFYQNEMIESFENEFLHNRAGLKRILRIVSGYIFDFFQELFS